MSELRQELRIYGPSLAITFAVTVPLIAIYLALFSRDQISEREALSGGPIRIELQPATPLSEAEASRLRGELTQLPADSVRLLEDLAAANSLARDADLANSAMSPARATPSPALRAAVPEPDRDRADDPGSIDFDISDPYVRGADVGSAIEIRKMLRVNGADAGPALIRVSGSSTLSIARNELSSVLARAGRADVAAQLGGAPARRFVSFDEMRRQGIHVRYDAPSDRVQLTI